MLNASAEAVVWQEPPRGPVTGTTGSGHLAFAPLLPPLLCGVRAQVTPGLRGQLRGQPRWGDVLGNGGYHGLSCAPLSWVCGPHLGAPGPQAGHLVHAQEGQWLPVGQLVSDPGQQRHEGQLLGARILGLGRGSRWQRTVVQGLSPGPCCPPPHLAWRGRGHLHLGASVGVSVCSGSDSGPRYGGFPRLQDTGTWESP